MIARTAPLALLLALAGCSSFPHPWPHDSLCTGEVQDGASLDTQTWLALVLHGYDRGTRRATTPALDCSGTQIRWEAPAFLCTDASIARTALPDRPLGDGDVVVSEVDPSHRLVWILTTRYASGDALGPVAMVEVRGKRLRVEALGSLRANPERAKLKVLRTGASSVLVAEGERCSGATAASCERSSRIMTLLGKRFEASRIVNAGGDCLGAGWLHLTREEVDTLASGRQRRYRVDASLSATKDGLRLLELVTVHDREGKSATAPERLFRRAEGTTVFRVSGSDLVSETPTLWARLLSTRE
jgi:hypothetical protein